MAASRTTKAPAKPARRRLQRPLLAILLLAGAFWFMFFDSYSLIRRISWHQEYTELAQENEALAREVEQLETRLAEPVTDEVIEQIAREQYGMRRPGETVYRVEEQ